MRRAATSLATIALWMALSAPAALAHDGGEGWFGETDDKIVTNAGFLLIAFFPLLVALLSFIQWRLDKRKDARKQAQKARLGRTEWRGGW